jgi:hypothetical protein
VPSRKRGKAEEFRAANAGRPRLGLGRAFHITPSNVPVNFAFSFAFGLLSGNANVVRTPSRPAAQTDVICGAIRRVAARPAHSEVGSMSTFVRYGKDDALTASFSAGCAARLIWGGDASIQSIRKIPVPERAVEVVFADRYSICALEAGAVRALDDAGLARLADRFFNDTYAMDQNACSSPHLVLWMGEERPAAQRRFWEAVEAVVRRRYDLAPVRVMDKYEKLCEDAMDLSCVSGVTRHGNFVYRALRELPFARLDARAPGTLRIRPGRPPGPADRVNAKYQTLTYFGPTERAPGLRPDRRLTGIDRIVPVGSAPRDRVFWDGHDLVGGAPDRRCQIARRLC